MKPKRTKTSGKTSDNRQLAATSATVSTEKTGKESVALTDKASQGLKFVDVTTRYVQGTWNPAEQKSIRIHVMQDFLRQRKQPVHIVEPPAMAGTVSTHVHRFRIAKPLLPGGKGAGTASSSKGAIDSGQSRESTSSATSFIPVQKPHEIPEFEIAVAESADRPSRCDRPLAEEVACPSTLPISPNLPGVMSRMDPFARLPIDASVETHEVLDYYRTSYWSNSLAVNPDGRWLSIAATDPALFHAQLSLVIQHQALMRGNPFPEQYYHHRGLAITIVTSRLGHPVEAISDPTIGAVALLANSDNYLDVAPEAQNSHIKGLISMVQLRGGIQTLGTNESIKRVVTWADLVHAATNDGRPRLGMSKCNAGYDLSQLFPATASEGSPARIWYPEHAPVPAPLREVFETIRLLSIAQSSPDTVDLKNTFSRRILANVLYRVEYLLLDPTLLPLYISKGQETSKEWNYANLGRPLLSAITAGALIFTYSCLRNLAIQSRPFQGLVSRLQTNLQLVFDEEKSARGNMGGTCLSLEEQMDSQSSVNGNPPLLLWLLMHGFKAALQGQREGDREWFTQRGAETCRQFRIQSLDQLCTQINQMVVFKTQCTPTMKAFWQAICNRQDIEGPVLI